MAEATQSELCIVLGEHSLPREDLKLLCECPFDCGHMEEPSNDLGPEKVPSSSTTRKKKVPEKMTVMSTL